MSDFHDLKKPNAAKEIREERDKMLADFNRDTAKERENLDPLFASGSNEVFRARFDSLTLQIHDSMSEAFEAMAILAEAYEQAGIKV